LERFVRWAETRSDLRAAVVVGSRARVDQPADEWADLDVIVVTTGPERYLSTASWVESIGNPLLTFVEPTATGDEMERRVLFEGMLDVDFSIIPEERARQLLNERLPPQVVAQISDTFSRGVRVLLDKDGLGAQLLRFVGPLRFLLCVHPRSTSFLRSLTTSCITPSSPLNIYGAVSCGGRRHAAIATCRDSCFR